MSDCENGQKFDVFIRIILNTSLYLGYSILILMGCIGVYFFVRECFIKPYKKRREKKFLGISSQPSFVATIQFAFANNLNTFQEIVTNRPVTSVNNNIYYCPSCGSQKENLSKIISGSDNYCNNCGTALQLQQTKTIN